MASIFNITGEFMQLLEMARDGEVDEEVLADTIESVQMEFDDKADNCAYVIDALRADSNALDAEIKRLKARKDSVDKNMVNVKKGLENCMRAINRPKFKTLTHTFYIGKNAPSANILDDRAIPSEFLIPQPDQVDKRAIIAYLKANGDTSWAELVQTESLKIR